MHDLKYLEWNQKRIKGIVDFYSHKFFYYKKIVDLGCRHADLSGVLYRLGSDITAVDARQEHLKIASKKFVGIKTVKADLDRGWPFGNQKFDMALDLDLICHLKDYESHLRSVCASVTHLILESTVCDSDDPTKVVTSVSNKNIFDLSFNGVTSSPSSAAIERVLRDCGMNFKRLDQSKFNSPPYTYDWQSKNNNECDINKRRIWFAVKNTSPIQFANIPNIDNSSVILPPQEVANKIEILNSRKNTQPSTQLSKQIINIPNISLDKRFVIVIPSYNNQKWCEKNISSSLTQSYDKYRIIFTDDASSDGTFDKVSKIVNASPNANKCTLIRNTTRLGALANLYNMICSCDDDEIILTLDGDDWFPHDNVLNKLKEIYSQDDVWMTYGQYQNHPDKCVGIAYQYPDHVISSNNFRQQRWGASHLRTFYSWLFKKIKKEDLFYNGQFMSMTWDFAIMFPMLEMSGVHSKFIPDILYIYNLENPINDHKVNAKLQQDLDKYMRCKPKYTKIERSPIKNKVGLFVIATGKYDKFIQGLISSADNYFLNNNRTEVTYYIFTDSKNTIQSTRNIVYVPIEHKPFPHASMDRFKHFIKNENLYIRENFLYYVDVDCRFVAEVGEEIFGNLVGVQHCGFMNKPGSYEDNTRSVMYVPSNHPKKYKFYAGGGFSGGRREKYLELARCCDNMIDKDIANGIIPRWHDETALNRYFLDNHPDVILTPSYHYPESNIENYKKMWAPKTFSPKILLLDKDHKAVRG